MGVQSTTGEFILANIFLSGEGGQGGSQPLFSPMTANMTLTGRGKLSGGGSQFVFGGTFTGGLDVICNKYAYLILLCGEE